MGDILSFPELAESTISLHDIDQERLRTSEVVAHKVAEVLNVQPTIEATTDRRAALDGEPRRAVWRAVSGGMCTGP